jgi:hypothetical protein
MLGEAVFNPQGFSALQTSFDSLWSYFRFPRTKLFFSWRRDPDERQLSVLLGLACLRNSELQFDSMNLSCPSVLEEERDLSDDTFPEIPG